MKPDPFQQAWKSESARMQVTIDTEVLSKEVHQSHKRFQSMIFWRDVREAGTSLLLIPFWLAMGIPMEMPWTWYLTVPALVWIAGFILVDRRRHPQRPSSPGEPLLFYAKESLTQVEHQIWLLRNVFWWYLLPFCISLMAFFMHVAWQTTGGGWGFIPILGFLSLFLFVTYRGVYRLNQSAVRKQLEPRRQNLSRLVDNLAKQFSTEKGDDQYSDDLMDLVSAISEPMAGAGLNSSWAENWNQIIPSWRQTSVIMLATLAGSCCGLFSGLWFQIRDMGPTFFQAVIGAVIPFEATLGWYMWQRWKQVKNIAAAELPPKDSITQQNSLGGSVRTLLPQTPAVVILVMIVFLSVMAVLALVTFRSSRGNKSTLSSVKAPEFDDISALDTPETASINAWLQDQVNQAKYPSLTVAIVRDGEIAYGQSFGFENIARGEKATLQTRYHVASVTKAFTASLAVMMHEQGLVDLDQPAVKYLPAGLNISTKPDAGATITLRQLASHTSGLPRSVPGRVQSTEGWYELEPQRLYDHLANVELETKPGTAELYSNLGFGLLGHTLERAAKKPFAQLIQEMICEPLQLQHTAIQVDGSLKIATGYDDSERRYEKTHSFRERLAASGGLVTSAEDLSLFLSAQMSPDVFSSEMLEQIQRRTRLTDGSMTGTSLGWSLGYSSYLGSFLKKNGGRGNCSAWIGYSPKHGIGVVVLTNSGGPDVDRIGRWLLERSVPGVFKPVTKFGYAKVAPFTGVRWQNDRPIVRLQDQWSSLISIDGIPVDRIMEFANKEYDGKAQKRFTEDLVEVLAKMGHEPKWEVALETQSSDGTIARHRIRMTEENRALARTLAQENE